VIDYCAGSEPCSIKGCIDVKQPMSKRHIIISGTGRTGTTFLVQLLTALGLDTGFTDVTSALYPNCDAGMERDIRDPDAPYIIKTPRLCDHLEEVLESGELTIDHAILPVRDLYSAAESRRDVTRRTDAALFPGEIPGGLWHTDIPELQESALAIQLYKLIHTISKRDIPVTLLYFPRLVNDCEYLYIKLGFLLNGIAHQSFQETFNQIARPQLVHDFRPASTSATLLTGEESNAEEN
jgi:hypothetical protein